MQETRHRRLVLDPWVGNNPWRMAWQPTPVFLPADPHEKPAAAAAAAAKSLQSCPTLCNPIDSSPPGSSVPGILQARTLEIGRASCRERVLIPV